MTKKTIYFLCTGNSCRSQMAEGWAKIHLGKEWEVRSAGIEAHGLNPNAVKADHPIDKFLGCQITKISVNKKISDAIIVEAKVLPPF